MARTPVYLNVYDMYWLNEYASNLGVGVFHSGIEVYGLEYAYGGHPLPFSGIFENSPKDANELGDNFKFRECIFLGETDFSSSEVKRMIILMGEEYRGDRYHLITKNCNHFSSYLAKTLSGTDIPSWVNRLASISGSIPFLERWIPQEWLTPIALQNSLDGQSKTLPCSNSTSSDTLKSNGSRSTVLMTERLSNSTGNQNSWKLFPRRSFSNTSTNFDLSSRSAPNTARSAVSASNVSTSSNQSLSRLWTSIKNITSQSDLNATSTKSLPISKQNNLQTQSSLRR